MKTNQATHSCELSIVMPCLNEAETLASCIHKARGFLERNQVEGEIVVADNGSTDGSQDIARSHGARVIAVTEKGYGSALMGGIRAAHGKFIIMGDADDSYDFAKLEGFISELQKGADLVMGNRFKGGIIDGAMPPLHKYLGNPVLSGIGRLFFRSPINDFHCGLRGFRRESILALDLHTSGMEFASEMVVKATLNGLRITEIPIVLHPDGRSRAPHLRSWRDGWRHLRFLLMYSPRWLFLYPGLFLIGLGLMLQLLLLPGPVKIARLTLDIHTLLLSSCALILGVQTVTFAVLAKKYAINTGLLPHDHRFVQLIDKITLEKALVFGLATIFMGVFLIIYGIYQWYQTGFGELVSGYMMRILIPAVTMLAVGFQIIIASFFSGILNLKNQKES
ncbi:glycosyltransferase family 2 protein [Desulfofustis limnaeus]|uniref:Dolichol-P-glucose synthetase n=1 Tax=Desulfofustis limnaeus TaxID=2740163 RepID=A0ABM7W950_9BACT|nr:glycosyltransferase family 2 protein [Desulfofustis limnaeus]MDX9894865.1 glycosyltransferase family 2 protein [Desulfofustis sp.]BDD87458.1 dolichol-P-glucose synthetase [Desulfofustis limnaeus]